MAWLNFLVLLLGLLILAKSAHLVISAITHLGHSLKLSQFVTGFIILGIATSAPEIFIGLQSALVGNPQLSLGNLWGANIVLLTLLAGVTAITNRGVNVKSEFSHSHRLTQILGLVLAPVVFFVDGSLSRPEAALLLGLYLGYVIYVYARRPAGSTGTSLPAVNHHLGHTLLLASAGILGLAISSRSIVVTAINLATLLHLPQVIIGTLLLSVGTNLPEISVVLEAVRQHHPNLVIGDVLGSAATNTLVTAGLGLIAPFSLAQSPALVPTAGIMVLATVGFYLLSRSHNRISPTEGWVLIGLYLAFLASQITTVLL